MIDTLHVVGAYYNHRPTPLLRPRHTRLHLLYEWVSRLLDTPGIKITLVEHAIGQRPYELNPEDQRLRGVRVLHLRGTPEQELWLSFALLNYGFGHLEDARYLCYQDTDIKHDRADWAERTVDMLQLHRVGQTWSDSVDLGPSGEIVPNERGHMVDRSFAAAWLAGDHLGLAPYGQRVRQFLPSDKKPDSRAHPGYSVAIRRSALQGIGRLIDWDVAGSCDWHMWRAFSGTLTTFDNRMSPSFNRKLREFAARCDEHIRQDIGVVPGLLLAGYHGSKKDRHYIKRNELLRHGFDPDIDMAYDVNGIPTLVTDNRQFRDGIRRYNQLRNEDNIEV